MSTDLKALAERFRSKAKNERQKASELRRQMDLHIRAAETWDEAADDVQATAQTASVRDLEKALCK
jgi:hypothetical protein